MVHGAAEVDVLNRRMWSRMYVGVVAGRGEPPGYSMMRSHLVGVVPCCLSLIRPSMRNVDVIIRCELLIGAK